MRAPALGLGLATLLLSPAVTPAFAQGDGYPTLSRADELRLAMSAGPLTVSRQADVYVMGKSGFEKAISGTNGWACLVVRSAEIKTNLAPHCLNHPAVASVLPALQLEASLQAKGWDHAAITAEMARRWKAKTLPLPSGPAYAYMMSSGQRLGPSNIQFKPHFMLFVPYASNASIGGDPQKPQFPFVGPFENHPLSSPASRTRTN